LRDLDFQQARPAGMSAIRNQDALADACYALLMAPKSAALN
jgi:hypothetical protein